MRKIIFLFCVLMIVPTLTLANSDMVSVSELCQQVEMMGRWTKNYDTPNGEVSVDIPVIVPDVDELPILEIQAVTPEDDGFSWDENDQSVYILSKEDSFTEYADHNLLKFINPQLEADAPSTFFVSERNVMLQAGHDWVYVRRGGRLKYGYKSHYGFEPEIDGIYAEGNINCLLDAKKALQKVLDYFYPREENRFYIYYVEIRERARKVKDLSESGGYVDEYPMGTYYLDLRQVMHGLPIYTGVGERIDSFSADRKFDDAEVKKCFKIEGISISYFEYMTDDSFDVRVCWVREKNMIENDVPLASLQCILREIEQKIKHGNIRNVYEENSCGALPDDEPADADPCGGAEHDFRFRAASTGGGDGPVAKDLCHAERRTERGYPDSRTGCGEMSCHHGGKRSAVYVGNRRRDAEKRI